MGTDRIITEAIEVCPHCGRENVFPNWDVEKLGYIATCQGCGEQIMLCDECLHADDNPGRKCDWHGHCVINKWSEGECFRGRTRMEVRDGKEKGSGNAG